MSDSQSPAPSGAQDDSRGVVMASAFLGVLIGAAGTFAGIFGTGYHLEKPLDPAAIAAANVSQANPAPPAGAPGMMGPPPGMGGPMMGGGGARGKRNLTQLVGKLELLTRGKLDVALSPEQTAKLSPLLAELNGSDKMTADEAQERLDALEGLLTSEQKEIVESIGLPFGGRGGLGGRGGGMGGMMGGGMPGMGGGPPDDENPFKQEANQKRLHDLLTRINPNATEGSTPDQ